MSISGHVKSEFGLQNSANLSNFDCPVWIVSKTHAQSLHGTGVISKNIYGIEGNMYHNVKHSPKHCYSHIFKFELI